MGIQEEMADGVGPASDADHTLYLEQRVTQLEREQVRTQQVLARLRHLISILIRPVGETDDFLREVGRAFNVLYPNCLLVTGRGHGEDVDTPFLLSPGLLEEITLGRDVIHCNFMRDDERWKNDPLVEEGFGAFLGTPMRDGMGRLYGWMLLLSPEPKRFSVEDRDLLSMSAGLIAGRLRSDVQEQSGRELEQHLRHVQKMQVVSKMAGGVAHDFNNLLSGILGYVSHLLNQPEPGPEWREDLRMVRTAAERAAHLTKQLLSFSRKRPIQRQPLSLNVLLRDTVQMLRYSMSKRVEVVFELDPNLPQVHGDEGQLGQVIVNLCVNAADAMKCDGGTLTLRTFSRALTDAERGVVQGLDASADRCVILEISDDGCGMDDEVLEHLFEPFYTTKAEEEGTGLGLSMVYGIVSNHGGEVLVESVAGKGSVFTVMLPPGEEPKAATDGKPIANRLRGTEHILVVEDDTIVREMVERTLRRYDYRVAAVSDGVRAMEWLAEHPGTADLVLMDVIMPRQDGLQTWALLKKQQPELLVLLMTGHTSTERYRAFIARENPELLEKPFSSGELVFRLRTLLDED